MTSAAKDKPTGLALLRMPFPENQISKRPNPTKAQTEAVKSRAVKAIKCGQCGQYHHPDADHLEYVGHAALTNRLLDCDEGWGWDFVATDDVGLPVYDRNGGLWIKLTVCGVSRLGYGDAPGKTGGNGIKECIGDALRNAAMRFGAALDLWHKGELHVDEPELIDDDQITKLTQLMDLHKVSSAEFLEKSKIKDISELTADRFTGAANWIASQSKSQEAA